MWKKEKREGEKRGKKGRRGEKERKGERKIG